MTTTFRRILPGLPLLAVTLVAALSLAGCGKSADERMWDGVGYLHMDRVDLMEVTDNPRSVHAEIAESLDFLLRVNDDAPQNLRRVVEELRDGERALAEGTVSGAEADELRQRLDDYWSHLSQRQLPPDYQ